MGSFQSFGITEMCASSKLGESGVETDRELNALRKWVNRTFEKVL